MLVPMTKAQFCFGSIGVSLLKVLSKPVRWAAPARLTLRKRQKMPLRTLPLKKKRKRSQTLWRTGKLSKLGRDTTVAVSLLKMLIIGLFSYLRFGLEP